MTHRQLKRLGQHFLSDPRILDRIAGALELRGDETVVEIGPGKGALTERLAPHCARLIAIEIDRALPPLLRTKFADRPHVEIVEADVLAVVLADIAGGPFVLIGNVPYYITTPILFHALKRPRADRAVYLVQREVAERMRAAPGSKEYGALTVNVQAVARVELLFHVPAGAFTPPPKVESAVVRITPRPDPVVAEAEEDPFRRFVQAAFGQRRKQLKAIVRTVAAVDTPGAAALISSAGFAPEARAETLSVAELAHLFRTVRVA